MDRTREFHQRQVERGEISSDEPRRMCRLANVPVYLDVVWRNRAERCLTSKQEVINYSIASGLQFFEEKRKGKINTIDRAQTALWDEAGDLQLVHKIFSGNDIPLSNGPGEDHNKFLGFRSKMSCRIGENLDEKADHYKFALGIPKGKFLCIMSMIYMGNVQTVPDHYKVPMRKDVRAFLDLVSTLYQRARKLVEEERTSSKPSYNLNSMEDLFD